MVVALGEGVVVFWGPNKIRERKARPQAKGAEGKKKKKGNHRTL